MLAAALTATSCSTAAATPARDDLPPVGHSRFDELIGDAPVPYPFSRLVAKINRQMHTDAGGLPPLKVTLIPLGRSLQREAGAPDFFRFPRVVAAADGDNKAGFSPLKDRLFLGFHEKGEVVEVISYNDAAGRFEFQVVRDYRAGGKPGVFYARRSLCLACHQNAAPIFARPLWDETPANPVVARKLKAAGRDFYGVKLSGTDIAYFIDNATDRANLFSVWQTLWRQGCGAGEDGDRCRRRAFAAALDYVRFGKLPPADALPALMRNWHRLWQRGLAIPNPDLPNRDPLAVLPGLANHASSDPLQPRAPLEIWRQADATAFIVGLAGMLDSAAVKRLARSELDDPLERLRARGVFADRPFSQAPLAALLAELGLPVTSARAREKLPPPRAEAHALDDSHFQGHCGVCHDRPDNEPPNFLHGDAAAVDARLDHCAERIFYRLSMAKTTPARRGRSPMPPATMLAARGMDAATWARSPGLEALLRDIGLRLRSQGIAPESLLAKPYAQLRACLPPETAQ